MPRSKTETASSQAMAVAGAEPSQLSRRALLFGLAAGAALSVPLLSRPADAAVSMLRTGMDPDAIEPDSIEIGKRGGRGGRGRGRGGRGRGRGFGRGRGRGRGRGFSRGFRRGFGGRRGFSHFRGRGFRRGRRWRGGHHWHGHRHWWGGRRRWWGGYPWWGWNRCYDPWYRRYHWWRCRGLYIGIGF